LSVFLIQPITAIPQEKNKIKKTETVLFDGTSTNGIGCGFDVDSKTGIMYDRDAMKLWKREYEQGWEPKI
jgi:hypothetical protein